MSRRVVLIACVSMKRATKTRARDLYVSPLFRYAYAYAQLLKPDRIFILSAKHGLVEPERILAPYDETLVGAPDKRICSWADKTFAQLARVSNPARDEYVFLAGERYRRHLAPRLANVRVPAEGLGIGKQLQFFKNAVSHGLAL